MRVARAEPVPLLLALLGAAAVVSALTSASHVLRPEPQPAPPMVTVNIAPRPPEPKPRAAPLKQKPAVETPAKVAPEPQAIGSRMERILLLPLRDRQSSALAVVVVPAAASPLPGCGFAEEARTPLAKASRSLDLSAFGVIAATPEDRFRDELCSHVEAHRPIAPAMADEGLALARVRIDRAGTLIEARIEQSSGNERLDAEALALIHRAAQFPRVPGSLPDPFETVLPIRFPAPDPAGFAPEAK